MKYRKTALVEAEQFLPNDGKIPEGAFQPEGAQHWGLNTLEGIHELRDGDYICTGPNGERWNVKREIFEATYEPADPLFIYDPHHPNGPRITRA